MITCKIHSVHETTTNKLLSNSENFHGTGFWDTLPWIFIKGIPSDLVGNNLNIPLMVQKNKGYHAVVFRVFNTMEEHDIKIKSSKSWNSEFQVCTHWWSDLNCDSGFEFWEHWVTFYAHILECCFFQAGKSNSRLYSLPRTWIADILCWSSKAHSLKIKKEIRGSVLMEMMWQNQYSLYSNGRLRK